MDNGTKLFYDKLYLFSGLQYNYPKNIRRLINEKKPKNLHFINHQNDLKNLLDCAVKNNSSEIILYGNSIELFSVVDYLKKSSRIELSKLICILPKNSHSIDSLVSLRIVFGFFLINNLKINFRLKENC